MFRPNRNISARHAFDGTGGRELVAPEKLEPRYLPGAFLYFAPPLALQNDPTEVPAVVSTLERELRRDKVLLSEADRSSQPITDSSAFDRLYLLSKSDRSGQTTSVNESPGRRNVLQPDTVASRVNVSVAADASISLATFGATDLLASATDDRAAPLNAQPMPFAPLAGGNSGGGGGSANASGPPASGPGGAAAMNSTSTNPMSTSAMTQSAVVASAAIMATPTLSAADVKVFIDRAAAATSRNDAIIAVVDRNGTILGVRVEAGVAPMDAATRAFAIDGAVAKARTAAFFSNDQAPLTSRTVRFVSQSTVTQREVQANPNATDPTVRGPGFVAPIGLGGHFPAGVMFAPLADLFAIEHTNRDSLIQAGNNGIRGDGDDIFFMKRFGADFIMGQEALAPESYGFVSGTAPTQQSRGIATLPGGVGLYQFDSSSVSGVRLVGGIGVFFPGPNGYATFEQNFIPSINQSTNDRLNAPLVKHAEYMAVAAAGGVGTIAGIPLPMNYVLPTGRIDLAGITLEIYGANPGGLNGLLAFGQTLGTGTPVGMEAPVTTGGALYLDGKIVPEGWLVAPRASMDGSITAAEVEKIIEDGEAEANLVRAAIRLPIGTRTKMVFSVTDKDGNILGLYRMPDATVFSIDVAVAKARNVAYYDEAPTLQPQDRVDDDNNGVPDVAAGVSFTNRTFRYLAAPFFPESVDGQPSGDFSILNDPGINKNNGENLGAPTPASAFTSVLGYDSFNPGTNFREPLNGNQNGVVFFPGSTALYKNGVLVGGFGVSGDGVDQDDVVTFVGSGTFLPKVGSGVTRADEVFVRGIRLPFQKFPRNPHG